MSDFLNDQASLLNVIARSERAVLTFLRAALTTDQQRAFEQVFAPHYYGRHTEMMAREVNRAIQAERLGANHPDVCLLDYSSLQQVADERDEPVLRQFGDRLVCVYPTGTDDVPTWTVDAPASITLTGVPFPGMGAASIPGSRVIEWVDPDLSASVEVTVEAGSPSVTTSITVRSETQRQANETGEPVLSQTLDGQLVCVWPDSVVDTPVWTVDVPEAVTLAEVTGAPCNRSVTWVDATAEAIVTVSAGTQSATVTIRGPEYVPPTEE